MKENREEFMTLVDKYYIKTRGIRLDPVEAIAIGIRRIYNVTSDINFMDTFDLRSWGLKKRRSGVDEAVIIESAIKIVDGVPLYVSTCIVFNSLEMCNIFYMKNKKSYNLVSGFFHLYN